MRNELARIAAEPASHGAATAAPGRRRHSNWHSLMNDGTTLYEQIGGESTVERLIDNFYDRVLADPELAPFFKNTSMDKLQKMQQEFFASALDGPATMSELDLSYAHHGRGIRVKHFNRFVQHLLATLASIGVNEQQQMEVIRRISTYVNDITGEVSTDS